MTQQRVFPSADANRAAQLSALYDLALRLSGVHDLTALLQDTVNQARRLTLADVSYLALREDDDALTIKVTDGSIGPRLRGVRLAPGSGLGGEVVKKGEPMQTVDYLRDTAFHHHDAVDGVAVEEQLRTILGVPLRLRGAVTGVLMVALREPRSFSSDELSLLSSLASLAAVAIENVRLMDQYREAAEALERTNRELEARVDAIAQAGVLHDRMLEVALQSGGTQDVLTSLSDMLPGAVVMLDEDDRVRVRAVDGRVDAAVDSTPWPSAAAAYAEPTSRHTVIDDDVVLVPIATPREYYGALRVAGVRLDEWEIRALERAAMTLTLVAAADYAHVEADRRTANELLEQLVTRRVEDEVTFARRARPMGFDLHTAHWVVVARPTAELRARVLSRASEFVHGGGLAAVVLGAVVVLARADEQQTRDFAASLAPLAGNVGLAGPAAGGLALAVAYDDARACLAVLEALERTGAHATPGDLGPYRFLLSEAGRADGARFVRQTIGSLLEHDADRGTDLARTAAVFLGTGRQHAATAAQLRIHPNTLYQRLDRITARLEPGWRDGDRALDVQLALRLHGLMSGAPVGPGHWVDPPPSTPTAG